jgi:hypothetical protein
MHVHDQRMKACIVLTFAMSIAARIIQPASADVYVVANAADQ